MEITQFTYFQQVGGIDLNPICSEITYGLERIAMYLQGIDNVYDLEWAHGVKYGDVHHQGEVEWSHYNFEEADVEMLRKIFDMYEAEGIRMAERGSCSPPTTAASSAPTPSTCSMPGGPSASPSARPTSAACATWQGSAPRDTSSSERRWASR